MRIGDSGTDGVYDKLIAPAIRRAGLTPRRIDRLMHNERIDLRILTELGRADVVVADLTFARPSVYWEAGYAERQVPVVYTCRRDHFRPRSDDDFGNFKVHFDLQTKNIIAWTGKTDRRFRSALEARLHHVLRPILRERERADTRCREEEKFAALSLAGRRKKIVNLAITYAHRLGIRGTRKDADIDDFRFAPQWFAVALYAALLAYDAPRVAHTALVVAISKMTKTSLRQIRDHLTQRPLDRTRYERARARTKTVVDHGIVFSFNRVDSGVIGETLSSFERDLGTQWPAWSEVIYDSSTAPVRKRTVKVHVLGNIRSESQAREAVKQVLQAIRSSRRSR